MRAMLIVKLAILAIVAFSLVGTTMAQGKGKPPTQGQPTQGQPTQQQDRDRMNDQDRDRDMDRDKTGDRDMDRDQDRDRIRLNDSQADLLSDRIRDTDQTRDRIHTMLRDYDKSGFTSAQGQEHHMRIREQFRNMEQEHKQFMNGLDNEQKNRWQNRIMTMEQQRERIENRLQLMEQQMNNGQFDRIRQRNWVREIEKAMKEWREQYHKVQHEGVGT